MKIKMDEEAASNKRVYSFFLRLITVKRIKEMETRTRMVNPPFQPPMATH
ncbi:Hypothetical protein Tpal_1224 [Trichococcus palustris]|uniref:Uncharacterized protein n=1 Tax=Trichococcus palustris TaxID=140314 RepID=A0A143YGJ9_9LACT|nr:hypothetical protein [Trichococcus palustris]CZQ90183.1 Hypothetical protein Tpal_1224 [Trichococcus palustris]SFK99291.1 hypothetical protein SAMN04488076_11267 [Trichococcus palustris]